VAYRRLSMRKTREILRLAFEARLSQRAIARSMGVSNSTISEVFARLKAAGLTWPLPEGISDGELERRLYRARGETACGVWRVRAGCGASAPVLAPRYARRAGVANREKRRGRLASGRPSATPVARPSPASRGRIARLTAAAGVVGRRARRRVRTTIPAKKRAPFDDLVARRFVAEAPNQLWCGDLTYIHTAEGFLYCASVIDVFSRRVIGWAIDTHMRAELVCEALRMAVANRRGQVAGGHLPLGSRRPVSSRRLSGPGSPPRRAPVDGPLGRLLRRLGGVVLCDTEGRAHLRALLAHQGRGAQRDRPLDRGRLQPAAATQLARHARSDGLRAATAGRVQCSLTKLSTNSGQSHTAHMGTHLPHSRSAHGLPGRSGERLAEGHLPGRARLLAGHRQGGHHRQRGTTFMHGSTLRVKLGLNSAWATFKSMSISPAAADKVTIASVQSVTLSGHVYPALASGAIVKLYYNHDGTWRSRSVTTVRHSQGVTDGYS